jgi:glucose-6-phosphate 1-dehydrogenase
MLGGAGLHDGCQHGVADSRIMVEKPFGYDLTTAKELIARLHSVFSESQIFRIDHYLAKETAQNILTFRFANPIFRANWDRQSITGITITASETIGIEGRAAFYEPVGALRDVVQNHLLQLLVLVTMNEPKTLSSQTIHAEKLRLLQSIKSIRPSAVATSAVRGQYRGYRQEVGHNRSNTETFARLHLAIDSPQWRGVPLTLQHGKRLDRRSTAVAIDFADSDSDQRNTLLFRIQPDEGITVDLLAKTPGLGNQTQHVEMAFTYTQAFGATQQPSAYERVLIDGIRGDQTLFSSSAEVLESWRIVDAVVREWAKSSAGLIRYNPGVTADSVK